MTAHPGVPQHLVEALVARSGLDPLPIAAASEPERAADLLQHEGFVLVRDALEGGALERLRGGCASLMAEVRRHDPGGLGNRGPRRYSLGSCSSTRHQVHRSEWAALLDLPVVSRILNALWHGREYACLGGGGDCCLPGCLEHQALHSDVGHDSGLLACSIAPYVAVNFLLEDQTPFNGPIRQVPRTQHTSELGASRPGGESEDMLLSTTLCPATSGSAIFRDLRCWHGGTPNLSTHSRALPNLEFAGPLLKSSFWELPKAMPHEVWRGLASCGRQLSRYIVASEVELVSPSLQFWPDLGRHCFLRSPEVVPLFECCRRTFLDWREFEAVS